MELLLTHSLIFIECNVPDCCLHILHIYAIYGINVISSKCNRKAVPVNAPSLKPEHASWHRKITVLDISIRRQIASIILTLPHFAEKIYMHFHTKNYAEHQIFCIIITIIPCLYKCAYPPQFNDWVCTFWKWNTCINDS